MDASRTLKNRRGQAIIWIAVSLAAFLGFAALVIDFGYRHVTKSQLQNAADAGALAGAGDYKDQSKTGTGTPNLTQTRTVAQQLAQVNTAAGSNVQIGNDGSNALTSSNDITVGFWNYGAHTYNAQTTNINAVQVRTRRTSDSASVNAGPIDTFFGKIFGVSQLDVKAEAIAGFPTRASVNLAICIDACPTTPLPSNFERVLTVSPNDFVSGFAWTSLLIHESSAPNVTAYICKAPPNDNVCVTDPIYTSMGTQGSTMVDLQSLMYDPLIDSSNKICAGGAKCTSSSQQVTSWTVIVPVTKLCPAGSQGGGNKDVDPKMVDRYAEIRIKAICGPGGSQSNGCWPGSNGPPAGTCTGSGSYTNNVVVIDRLKCVSCNDPNAIVGSKPILLK